MVEPAGPFKIILSEPPARASDDLGNPAAEQVQVELSRLLDLDEGMAASIAGAMPIVILHGLSARQAGVARERLQVIVQLGCKVITTDDASDTLPHVNWPVLPPIAHLDDSSESRPATRAPEPTPTPAPGTLTCPSCNAAFTLSPLNGTASHGDGAHYPQSQAPREDRSETRSSNRRFQHEGTLASSRPSEESSSPDEGLQRETFGGSPGGAPPEEIEDDWMSPPVGKVPTPETAPQPVPVPELREDEDDIVPGGTARFNEAALLAYRQADQAPPPAEQTLPPPPPPPQPLPVSFGDNDLDLGAPSASHSGLTDFAPPPADASSFEATGSLHDSGSDILDLDPPHRGRELVDSGADTFSSRSSGDFQDDFDLLGDDPDSEEVRAPTLESLDELEESAPVHATLGSSSRPHDEPDPFPEDDPFSDDEFGRMLQSDESPRRGPAAPAPAPEGDLDAVLSLFGPEDEEPLDDMAGLQPAPLDLSAKGGGHRRNLMGSEFPSDILEPLNPSEAMEIIKSQKTRGAPRGARLASDDDFDLFGESGSTAAAPRAGRKAKKKTRGVPFSASGEDLDLFEDNPRPARSRSKSRSRGGAGGGGGGGADPFARARQAMDEERSASAAPPPAKKRREGGRSSSRRSRDRGRTPAPKRGGGGGGGGGGPAPKGAGDHGLVLSRISDPDKKERAAELIAEIKGCNLDDAARLTERTIIPVLKGVSRDVAEFHLDKFRRYKIAGRVTTRQRS